MNSKPASDHLSQIPKNQQQQHSAQPNLLQKPSLTPEIGNSRQPSCRYGLGLEGSGKVQSHRQFSGQSGGAHRRLQGQSSTWKIYLGLDEIEGEMDTPEERQNQYDRNIDEGQSNIPSRILRLTKDPLSISSNSPARILSLMEKTNPLIKSKGRVDQTEFKERMVLSH